MAVHKQHWRVQQTNPAEKMRQMAGQLASVTLAQPEMQTGEIGGMDKGLRMAVGIGLQSYRLVFGLPS
jgi:hypothetical protein